MNDNLNEKSIQNALAIGAQYLGNYKNAELGWWFFYQCSVLRLDGYFLAFLKDSN